MAYTDASSAAPYTPAPPPVGNDVPGLSRATWDELYRIAQRVASIERPTAVVLNSSKSFAVQAGTVWTRLFDINQNYDWQSPAGQISPAGVWTCPQEGLYNVTIIVEVPAFPSPGSRLYEATLRSTGHPVGGGADRVVFSNTGGPDEAALRLFSNFLRPLNFGDQVWFDLDLTEESYTGNVTIMSILNICRQASIKLTVTTKPAHWRRLPMARQGALIWKMGTW